MKELRTQNAEVRQLQDLAESRAMFIQSYIILVIRLQGKNEGHALRISYGLRKGIHRERSLRWNWAESWLRMQRRNNAVLTIGGLEAPFLYLVSRLPGAVQ